MKKKINHVWGIAFLTIVAMMAGCSSAESPDAKSVKILITTGGWGGVPCILEVRTDGTLEATAGDGIEGIFYGRLDMREHLGQGYEKPRQKTKKLSGKQIETINMYIERIDEIGNVLQASYEKEWMTDAGVIHAITEKGSYRSLYISVDGGENELQKLVYELVNISSIKNKRL